MIIKYNVSFDIDFLTMAIEADNWEVSFYLFNRFEAQIMNQSTKVVPVIVASFSQTSQFLKAKLHLTKLLISKFTFVEFKQLVNNIRQKIEETSLENNIFSHSPNPLLSMCLTYEVLQVIMKRSFSLSYDCNQLNKQLKEMMFMYIQEINKSSVLRILLLEKDYSGRDVLSIAVNLNLIDLIQQPKVVAEINRIYKSDFDCSGSMFEMSSSYQILCKPMEDGADYEDRFRFYQKRNMIEFPQTDCNFIVFLNSMYSRLKGKVVIRFLFVTLIFYIKLRVINDFIIIRNQIPKIIDEGPE